VTSLLSYHFPKSRQGVLGSEVLDYNHRPRPVKGSINPCRKNRDERQTRPSGVIVPSYEIHYRLEATGNKGAR
jgi:hypothetical protein